MPLKSNRGNQFLWISKSRQGGAQSYVCISSKPSKRGKYTIWNDPCLARIYVCVFMHRLMLENKMYRYDYLRAATWRE